MRITNIFKYGEDGRFIKGELCMDEKTGRIREHAMPGETVIDGKGAYAIPGLIDLHFHGCMGHDMCDADGEALRRMAAYEAANGVTTICPATMSVPEAELHPIMKAAASYAARPRGASEARFVGIHMEGPFISEKKKGAQAAVRAAFSLFGAERIILISDSMRAAGLSDGTYTLGGQEVTVHGKRALLSDGTIAGSATNLMDCMKNAVKEMKIPLEEAVSCVTVNPAKELGIYDRCGSLTPGKYADVVLLEENLDIQAVFLDGKLIF